MDEHQRSTGSGFTSDQTRAWAMAMQIVYMLVGAGVLGFGIDLIAGTAPWFTVGLGSLGLLSGVIRFTVQALAMNRTAAERYTREHPGGEQTGGEQSTRRDWGGGRDPDLEEIDHG